MVKFHVKHNRNFRRKIQKIALIFARLGNKIVFAAQPAVFSVIRSSEMNGRIIRREYFAQHCRNGGFTVTARNGDGMFVPRRQFAQIFGAR